MPTTDPVLRPSDLLRLLHQRRRVWIVSTVLLTAAAAVYSVTTSRPWEASQALVVRNDAHTATGQKPGKFALPDEMKTLQETILELGKSNSVLSAALAHVGPGEGKSSVAWPTEADVAALRDQVKLTPPSGAEFGKTEMFYLKVQAHDRSRAIALATAICHHLEARFQQLLDDKAGSMIAELERTVQVADAALADATTRLAELERSVGSDLAELRILQETPSATSDLRQKVIAVENELREAETTHRGIVELTSLLKAAGGDPTRLAALPDRLLKSHAALSRIIDGLSAARLRTSNLLGSKADDHPQVVAARAEEQAVLQSLHQELSNAIHIAETEERLGRDRVASLKQQLADAQRRLERLAGLRAEYANRVTETKTRAALADEARRNLADAHAARTAARSASLITRVDQPTTGANPVGPSRSLVVLAGMIGGLFAGLGAVFLTTNVTMPSATIAGHVFATQPHAAATATAATVEKLLHKQGGMSLKQALNKVAGQSEWN